MFNVKIIKQNRKTISITVESSGVVSVKCPKNLSEKTAFKFLKQKENWILKKLNENNLKQIKYSAVLNKKNSLVLGKLVPYIKKGEYERLSSEYLTQKTKEISQILGLKYNSLSFKNYKSRWGCCDAKKNVILNYKLYMLDEYTIKCVIVHELLHTLYLNHGTAFKNALKNVVGNTSIYKSRLNEVGFLLKI